MNPEPPPRIHVVAAAIADAQGRILIAQRPNGKHMAGGWEFPGGKVESGEQPLNALARELHEELGIDLGPGPHRPIRRISHAYPERSVFLEVWLVREFRGTPRGLDAQALRWCTLRELEQADMLPADQPIIAALRLPPVLVEKSTDDYAIGSRHRGKLTGIMCRNSVEARMAERGGADFVAMRLEMLDAELAQLCGALSIPLFARGFTLDRAWRAGASGVVQLEIA